MTVSRVGASLISKGKSFEDSLSLESFFVGHALLHCLVLTVYFNSVTARYSQSSSAIKHLAGFSASCFKDAWLHFQAQQLTVRSGPYIVASIPPKILLSKTKRQSACSVQMLLSFFFVVTQLHFTCSLRAD